MTGGEFAGHMEVVARELLGEPNQRLSNRQNLRFGSSGSLSVDLKKGTFYSFEESIGGGVLDLIKFKKGLDRPAAVDWMRDYLKLDVGKPHREQRIVATYDYQDEAGKLLFQVVRFDPKDFRQRRPDGAGGWTWSVKGVKRVPYRLPELNEAIALRHPIIIVEGEKAANALAAWGIPATCNPGGAGKWAPELSEYFRGADAVILPDNDSPGQKHAKDIASKLARVADRVRVLELPGLPPKGDVADWRTAGGTPEQFWQLVQSKAVPHNRYSAEAASGIHAEDGEKNNSAAHLISRRASEIPLEAIEWLWPGRIAVGKLTLIGGDPGLGKSQIAAFITARVTTESPWPCDEGRALTGNVVIFSAEDGAADTIVPRLVAAGVNRDRVEIVSGVVDSNGRRTFDLKADIALLEAKVRELGNVKLIVIDPISAYVGKIDGNDNVKTRNVLEPIAEMADRLRIAVLGVTHLNKGGSASGQRALLRFIGSIATIAAARAGFVVVEDQDTEGRILFLQAKNNVAPRQPGLAYRILQKIVSEKPAAVGSYVDWELGHVAKSADTALSAVEHPNDDHSALDEAKEFLRTELSSGEVETTVVDEQARRAGIAKRTLARARAELKIKTRREGFGRDGKFYLSLP